MQPWKHIDCGNTSEIVRRQSFFHYFLKRRRKPAATPTSPDPRRSMLVGSGTSPTSLPPSRTCLTSWKVAPPAAVKLIVWINCPLMAVTVKKFWPLASTVKVYSKKPPVMLIPVTWITTEPAVAAFMLNTARVKVSPLAKPKLSWVNAVFPVPPLTVAWPDGLALSNPLPLVEVKLTRRLLGPTVPVTVVTLVAGLSRTLSVP